MLTQLLTLVYLYAIVGINLEDQKLVFGLLIIIYLGASHYLYLYFLLLLYVIFD
jgi:hypothetical protein